VTEELAQQFAVAWSVGGMLETKDHEEVAASSGVTRVDAPTPHLAVSHFGLRARKHCGR
jgi:hypothetical protein